jgi:hypothetical protein
MRTPRSSRPITPRLSRLLPALAGGLALLGPALDARAQPFNVRTWYAKGQVFVIWQFPAPPAVPTDTVEVYASAAAQVNTGFMTKLGRVFFPEYTGARLDELNPASTLSVPTPAGGTYTLAADEGVFAYTPRAMGNLFFAVVDTGSTLVNAGNSSATAFNYDPVNDPVVPHPQFNGVTAGGQQYTAFVVFAEGRDDYNNQRPDIPVLGDADKNGVPHVFAITRPAGGLPVTPVPCLFAHHGGEGEYQLFLPGVPARANLSLPLNNGIVVTPDDSIYWADAGGLQRTNTSWFGYSPEFDPFVLLRPELSATATVVNFTQRRVHYIYDWLLSARSPQAIDPTRVAAIGHSGGGRGVSHLTRFRPERYAAVVVHTPASDLLNDPLGRIDYMKGNWDANLATNVVGPLGTLHVTDLFTMTTRISPTQRDFPLTRFFYGKRDQKDAAAWSVEQRAVLDALEASQMGYMLFWDEREHGVEKWDNETSDVADGNPDPWPDVAQWIAPVRTRRASAQYLVDKYRTNQTYPGFFNADADTLLLGKQLDPGPGDPSVGDPWGTWGGYFDWDTATMVDLATRWECTVYASAFAPASIDNALVTQFTADLAPRKTANFNPPSGTAVYWYALRQSTNTVSHQGIATADADSVVKVPGLTIPREDVDRVRVILSLAPLCLGQQAVLGPAFDPPCGQNPVTFTVQPQGSGPFTYQWQIEAPAGSNVWTNLSDGPIVTIGDVSGATTASLTFSNTTPGIAERVRCEVSNVCGTIASSPAPLEVAQCDCIDFNGDGVFPDNQDIIDFLDVFSGGVCPTGACGDIDFNNDLIFPDNQDVISLLRVFSGGPC